MNTTKKHTNSEATLLADSEELEARIRAAQSAHGDPDAQPWDYGDPVVLQGLIDSGQVWFLEGSVGRAAVAALESGACFLPSDTSQDFWGNLIPARQQLQPGTKGTLENAAQFYALS